MISRKVWVDGVFDAGESHTNLVYEKATNTFDAQGRLSSTTYYGSSPSPRYVVKVYYYLRILPALTATLADDASCYTNLLLALVCDHSQKTIT